MFWRLIQFLFTAGVFVFLGVMGVAAYVIWQTSQELPDYEALARYEPPVMTRVHAGDGALLAEFARERRLFVPISSIPQPIVAAFLSAEDKNFYQHSGIDFQGIGRAVLVNIQNRIGGGQRLVGASTITQQVAKNFLLSSEQTMTRKLKELLLALKIEKTFSKDQILELYLNEIYLGMGAYGVAAAALNYFDKSLHELDLAEIAYLAALPKAPNNYHPFRETERALERRNWVVDRMVENGYVGPQAAEAAKTRPLDVTLRPSGAQIFAAEYYAEEVRREAIAAFGEEKLYGGGLSIRTTLDPQLQKIAKKSLVDGLVAYDRDHGWRGPVTRLEPGSDWGASLAEIDIPGDIEPWRLAVVLQVGKGGIVGGLRPGRTESGEVDDVRHTVEVGFEQMKWARASQADGSLGSEPANPGDIVAVGDVIYVAPSNDGSVWQLVQMPQIEGAIVALDPHTGRVGAMVGGFSYARSQFNRAIQARRQPGSAFKPFVYAAALDHGYTPASVVMDAPFAVDQGNDQGIWRPQNYSDEYYGPSTLRLGIEKSRNVMTVRLAEDIGMDVVADYGRRFGLYDDLPQVLSMSLGAGETTLLRLAAAYAMLDNGGKQITPTLIDRVQDRFGHTVLRHDQRDCADCRAEAWTGQPEPVLPDTRAQVIDAMTAYQITSMMEGVIERGTATVVREVGKPLAGKTGTTNDERDAWFIGYSPDLVVGVFMGFDEPRPMGRQGTGGGLAAPIFRDFMTAALADAPAIPFRVPPGINLVRVSAKTGVQALPGDEDVIVEAFKPGTAASDNPMDVMGAGSVLEEVLPLAGIGGTAPAAVGAGADGPGAPYEPGAPYVPEPFGQAGTVEPNLPAAAGQDVFGLAFGQGALGQPPAVQGAAVPGAQPGAGAETLTTGTGGLY